MTTEPEAPKGFRLALGARLHQRRQALDMDHVTLAESTGISVKALLCFERGEAEPNAWDVLQLAQALGVSVDWLLRGG
jgi:transcriptional regulator with XRE-family HTH domain